MLGDYQKSIVCLDTANGNQQVAATNGDNAGPLNVPVTTGSDIVCTVTNNRETGKIEVVKDLDPAADTGRFNLQIDGITEKANAGDTDTTGEKTLNTGTHTVGETQGNAGVLSDYQKSIVCLDTANQNQQVAATNGDDGGPLNVPVTTGSDIVCTITNVRETGKIEVVKDLNPGTDTGRFNLQIDGTTEKANAGDTDTTGEKTLNTGTHTVGETQGNAGVLSDYQKSIVCLDTANQNQQVAATNGDDGGPAERAGHHGLGHRLHDHEHPRDRQARGGQGP